MAPQKEQVSGGLCFLQTWMFESGCHMLVFRSRDGVRAVEDTLALISFDVAELDMHRVLEEHL